MHTPGHIQINSPMDYDIETNSTTVISSNTILIIIIIHAPITIN